MECVKEMQWRETLSIMNQEYKPQNKHNWKWTLETFTVETGEEVSIFTCSTCKKQVTDKTRNTDEICPGMA